jgi:hypothetical protein
MAGPAGRPVPLFPRCSCLGLTALPLPCASAGPQLDRRGPRTDSSFRRVWQKTFPSWPAATASLCSLDGIAVRRRRPTSPRLVQGRAGRRQRDHLALTNRVQYDICSKTRAICLMAGSTCIILSMTSLSARMSNTRPSCNCGGSHSPPASNPPRGTEQALILPGANMAKGISRDEDLAPSRLARGRQCCLRSGWRSRGAGSPPLVG